MDARRGGGHDSDGPDWRGTGLAPPAGLCHAVEGGGGGRERLKARLGWEGWSAAGVMEMEGRQRRGGRVKRDAGMRQRRGR